VKKQRVKIELGKKVTLASIKNVKPDVVVIATGATHCIPNIPGADGDNVATASEVLLGKKRAGKKAVIIGGGEVGSELAWFLAEQGKQVTIVEMMGAVAMDMNMFSRLYLLDKLGELGVNMVIDTTVRRITDKGVVAIDAEGKKQVIKADTVILAAGFKCNNPLEKKLKSMVPEVYAIGDCVKPGKIEGAIGAAWRVALQI
jgi:pyruvate/2-oxoglutarate dehydrogenase complex dihydrolipoamide dehydrogenase (E3) component